MNLPRYCPVGNHTLGGAMFRTLANGKLNRECRNCEAIKQQRKRVQAIKNVPFDGVDIDAIHFKLGAVRLGVKPTGY